MNVLVLGSISQEMELTYSRAPFPILPLMTLRAKSLSYYFYYPYYAIGQAQRRKVQTLRPNKIKKEFSCL